MLEETAAVLMLCRVALIRSGDNNINNKWWWTTILTIIAISCLLMIMLTRVVTDNKDLGFATSQEELAEMCPKLMDGLRLVITSSSPPT